MSNRDKWVEWDKPVTVLSRLGKEMRDLSTLKPWTPGCFRFDDGTLQGWTLDQIYETASQNKLTPFSHPTTGQSFGFKLENSQGLALAATATPLVLAQANVSQCDIYLESPELSLRSGWQSISGYSVDLYRIISPPCGEPAGLVFYAQLQLRVSVATTRPKLFAEWDAAKKDFVFHPIKSDF